MYIEDSIVSPTWMFELGLTIRRFDVADSPTGLFTDLTWSLGERYQLPDFTGLEYKPEALSVRAAWHERGLFFEASYRDPTPFPRESQSNPDTYFSLFINTRYAPGIRRANSYCCSLGYDFPTPTEIGGVTLSSVKSERIHYAKEPAVIKVTNENSPGQLRRDDNSILSLKVFVGEKALPQFSPVEFPEISLNLVLFCGTRVPISYAYYGRLPLNGDPTHWCKVRLVQ